MAEPETIIHFAADRTLIAPGEPVTIRWHVEGVKEVYFYTEGQDWQGHGVAGVAERQVSPVQSTAYRLRVVKRDDQVEVRALEVHVRSEARLPLGQVFAVDRNAIRPGECVTFRWHVEGVREVYFYEEGQNWREHGVAGVAEMRVCPSQSSIYRLRVVRIDGSVEEHGIGVQLQVLGPGSGQAIAVDRALIRPGECVTFRWHVEGVREVYFYAEGQPWQEHGVAGVAERQVCPPATTTYCLRVVKGDGSLEVHYVAVTVAQG